LKRRLKKGVSPGIWRGSSVGRVPPSAGLVRVQPGAH
jgi:hypothetical protein